MDEQPPRPESVPVPVSTTLLWKASVIFVYLESYRIYYCCKTWRNGESPSNEIQLSTRLLRVQYPSASLTLAWACLTSSLPIHMVR